MSDDIGSIRVMFKGSAPDGLDEVRGEFWDLGRMKPDDPQLTGYDLRDDVSASIQTVRGRGPAR